MVFSVTLYRRRNRYFTSLTTVGMRFKHTSKIELITQKNRLKRRFFCVKSSFFEFRLTTFNCGQRVKIAVLSSVQQNAEISKIPNPSLTGITFVFSPQIRRKLEFSDIIHYNNFTEAFAPPRQPCGCIPVRSFS